MANTGSDGDTCFDYDYVVIGSGFGGSVSALRLTQKGYRVLVLEKGMRLGAADFPESNWDLKRWLWLPTLGCFGLFKLTFFRHVGVLSGVGVGGAQHLTPQGSQPKPAISTQLAPLPPGYFCSSASAPPDGSMA